MAIPPPNLDNYLRYPPGTPQPAKKQTRPQANPIYSPYAYPNYTTEQLSQYAGYPGYVESPHHMENDSTSLDPAQEQYVQFYPIISLNTTAQTAHSVAQPYFAYSNTGWYNINDFRLHSVNGRPQQLLPPSITGFAPEGALFPSQVQHIVFPLEIPEFIPKSNTTSPPSSCQVAAHEPDAKEENEDLNKQLLDAAATNSLKTVRDLLSKEIDVNTKDQKDGQTPLHKAIANRHYEIMEVLLKAGADKYALNNKRKNPMALAIAISNLIAVKALLNHKYDANHVDEWGQTPLHYLAKRATMSIALKNSKRIALSLLQNGALISRAPSALFQYSPTERYTNGNSIKIPNEWMVKIISTAGFDKNEILNIIKSKKEELIVAGERNPKVLDEYERVEQFLRTRPL